MANKLTGKGSSKIDRHHMRGQSGQDRPISCNFALKLPPGGTILGGAFEGQQAKASKCPRSHISAAIPLLPGYFFQAEKPPYDSEPDFPMRERFDETWFIAPLQAQGEETELPREESHHLRRVLRVPPGALIQVVNGTGTLFECSSEDAGDAVVIRAERILERQPRPSLNMALAVLKGRDLEEPVEGLCQLDLDRIELVVCDHSQVFKGQDFHKLLERLRQKSVVATKQAKKAWQTRILEPVPFREWLGRNSGACIVAALPGPDRLPEQPRSPVHLLVGPEGGFSKEELSALSSPEVYSLGLGPTRLRATHAPLLAAGKLMGRGWF